MEVEHEWNEIIFHWLHFVSFGICLFRKTTICIGQSILPYLYNKDRNKSTFVGRHLRGYWKYNWLTYTSSFYLIIFISHVNPWARITTSVSINSVNIFPAGPQDNAERGLVFAHYEFNTRALVFSLVTAYDTNISYSRWHDIRWKVIIN